MSEHITDETERSRKEHLLAEECRRAIEIASQKGDMALWTYDIRSGKINQSFQRTGAMGYPVELPNGPEDIIALGGIYEQDVPSYRAMYEKINDGAENSEATVRVYNRLSAKYEWQRITLTRLPDEETEAPTAIGFTMNVDLQKETQIRYERENRLRQELVKDAAIYYRINLTNRMVEELYSSAMDTTGITLPIHMDKLLHHGLFRGVYEPDRKLLEMMLNPEHMLRNYYNGKSTETFLYRRILPQKGLRWLKGSIAKLKRVSSDDVIAFFTALDVDDEKKEQLLLHDVMDEEIESLITMNPATKQLRIVMENRTFQGIDTTGTFPLTAEFRQAVFQGILAEDIAEASAFIKTEAIIEQLKTKPVLQHTYRICTSEGAVRRKKVRVFYLDESKQDIIFVRRDITDLYNEEERQRITLQRAIDDADAANKAKSDFLSRMSHDMRTPLNAIIGYSGKILRDGATEAQKDEFLDDIHASGKYLLGIINDVLDMTKIESNKMVLHPEAYTCREFKETVETVISPLCRKKGIDFEILFPANIDIRVMLDKVRFHQIFINILSNSVKFTPAGGKITFSAVRTELSDGRLHEVFTISDTGCGMSAEFLPHAFDSFSQEYTGQAMHNEQGTGLGLSIVKQLVELMDGTISVTSALGKGTTFTVELIVTPEKNMLLEAEHAFPKGSLRGLHLLLCEDHPMNSKIAVRLLEKEGCTVDTAPDGRYGLQRFQASAPNEYDAILMDIRMPNVNGLEAAAAIRSLPRVDAHTVPIIAMTANAFVEDKQKSLEAGMNAHIAKPIDPIALYTTLYRCTARDSSR